MLVPVAGMHMYNLYNYITHMYTELASFPGLLHLSSNQQPGKSYHVIHSTADVTVSRCNNLFTLISTATEKLESRGEASLTCKQSGVQSLTAKEWLGATPNICYLVASRDDSITAGYFHSCH